MIICNHCGSRQMVGTLFCEECGVSLGQSDVEITNQFTSSLLGKTNRSLSTTRPLGRVWDGHEILIFHISNTGRRKSVRIDRPVRIGRIDPRLDVQPEVDLSQEQGIEMGVSRMHASIEASDEGLILADLGSTNGTRLNSRRLIAQQPYILHDGDEIRFGRLLVQVHFEDAPA